MYSVYSLNTGIKAIKGIGPKKYEKMKSIGISSLKHALEHYPTRYVDRSKLLTLKEFREGESASVRMTVLSFTSYRKGGKAIQRCEAFDDEGVSCSLVFFNSSFLERKLTAGSIFYFYGSVEIKGGKMSMLYPEIIDTFKFESSSNIEAVYPLVSGISSKDISHIVKEALEGCDLKETLPERVIASSGICSYKDSLRIIHFPENMEEINSARNRIIFEEFFMLLLGLTVIKGGLVEKEGIKFDKAQLEGAERGIRTFTESLPYNLTGGQKIAIDQSLKDIAEGSGMNRLIQGDVGAGKTVVAVICGFFCSLLSGQSLIMAPTEILAKQHYETFSQMSELLYEKIGKKVNVRALTSSINRKDRESLKNELLQGEADILIGTHAVLEEDIEFKNLLFVVTDEQHRFGVRQRTVASSKKSMNHSLSPNVMVMSATPIPRTLSLMIYGDMDISTIYDMPEGRKPVKTRLVGGPKIASMHEFIKSELSKGKRAYFVCPMIEESEVMPLTDVKGLFSQLEPIYKDFKIASVHGKMSSEEKNKIMESFKEGEIQAIISTTVIEVGVNVPEATVMVIYDADRFGLAQLHQLRGRVGRGNDQAWCFLLTKSRSDMSIERLKVLCHENSGFEIAQKDLELRGSGQLLGTMQHGSTGFKMADIVRDKELLTLAQKSVEEFISTDNGSKDAKDEIYNISKNIFENFSI